MVTMMDYIKETPTRVLDIVNNSYEYTKDLVNFYIENKCEGLYFVASGSSYNGTLCAKAFMQHIFRKEIRMSTPFSFLHHDMEYIGNQMIICVSQSGCSTNTIAALDALKQKGHKTVCLVGRDDCDAKEYSDLLVNWKVQEEQIGFVTKGVTTLAAFEMMFVVELSKAIGIIGETKYAKIKENISKSQRIQPEIVDNTIKLFETNKQDFIGRNKVIFLSSGPGLAVATEAALKIAETSCINALACEAEEYLHGPLYPSTPDDVVIAIDNSDSKTTDRILDIALAIKEEITPKVYAITNSAKFDDAHAIRTSEQCCEHISPLYKLSAIQTLAYLMTEATNKYIPHQNVVKFKKANKVASKSRDKLYLNLQEGKNTSI